MSRIATCAASTVVGKVSQPTICREDTTLPFSTAASTNRRDTFFELLSESDVVRDHFQPVIEAPGNGAEVLLGVIREVAASDLRTKLPS